MNDREENLKRSLAGFFKEKQAELENQIARLRGYNSSDDFIEDYRGRNIRSINQEAIDMCVSAGYTKEEANEFINAVLGSLENSREENSIKNVEEINNVVQNEPERAIEIEQNEEAMQPVMQPEENKNVEDKENVNMYISEDERVANFANSDEFQANLKKLNEMRDIIKRMEENLAPYKKYGPMDGEGYLYAKEEQERIDLRKDELKVLEDQIRDSVNQFFEQRKEELKRMEENLAPYKKYGPMDGEGYLYAKEEQERIDERRNEMNRNIDRLLELAGIESIKPVNMSVTINDLENGQKSVSVSINGKNVYTVNVPENEFSSKKVEEICNSALLAYTLNQNKKNKAVINYNGKTVESGLGEIDKGIAKAIKAVAEEKETIKQKEIEEQKKIEEEQKKIEEEKKKKEEEEKKAQETPNTPETPEVPENEEEQELGSDEIDSPEIEISEPEMGQQNTPFISHDDVNEMAMKVTNSRNINMKRNQIAGGILAAAGVGLFAVGAPISIPIAVIGAGAILPHIGTLKDIVEYKHFTRKCEKIAEKYAAFNIDFVYDAEKRRADFVHYESKVDMRKGINGIYITEENYHSIFPAGTDDAFVSDFNKAFAKEMKRRSKDGRRENYPQVTPFDLRTVFVGIGGVKTLKEVTTGSMAIESYITDVEKANEKEEQEIEILPVTPEEIVETNELEETPIGLPDLHLEEPTPVVPEEPVTPEAIADEVDEELTRQEEPAIPVVEPIEEPEVKPEEIIEVPEVPEVPETVVEPPVENTPEALAAEIDSIMKEQQAQVPPVIPPVPGSSDVDNYGGMLTKEEIDALLGDMVEPENVEIPTPTPTSSPEEKEEFLQSIADENKALEEAEKVEEPKTDIFAGMDQKIQAAKDEVKSVPVELSTSVATMVGTFEENYKDVKDIIALDNAVSNYIDQAKAVELITTEEEEQQFKDYCNAQIENIINERGHDLGKGIRDAIKSGEKYVDALNEFTNNASDSLDIEAMNAIIYDEYMSGRLPEETYNSMKQNLDTKYDGLKNVSMGKAM